MFAALNVLSRPTLAFHDVPELLFLPQHSPTGSVMLHGAVSLKLPKQRGVAKLVIELVGTSLLQPPGQALERLEVLNRSCSLQLEHETLEAGEHAFQFEVEVPVKSAPSIRTDYGSVTHVVRATAMGAAWSGGALTAEKGIELILTPTLDNEPPPQEGVAHEYTEETQEFSIGWFSPSSSVGGCLLPEFHLSKLRHQGTKPVEMTYSLVEQVELRTLTNVHQLEPTELVLQSIARMDTDTPVSNNRLVSGAALCPPETSTLVVTMQESGVRHLKEVLEGRAEVLHNWIRLPSHDECKPSTPPEVDTPLRISHQLVWKMIYRNKDGKGRQITVKQPFNLASCRSMADTMRLPLYHPSPGKNLLRKGVNCCCSQSLEELHKDHAIAMEEAVRRFDDLLEQRRPPVEAERPRKP